MLFGSGRPSSFRVVWIRRCHSWGTVLGLLHAQARPETVAALICVAPVVSFSEQQRRAYAFDLAEAKRRGETGTLEEMRKLGEPPYETVDKANALERITTRYGCAFLAVQDTIAGILIAIGLVRGFRLRARGSASTSAHHSSVVGSRGCDHDRRSTASRACSMAVTSRATSDKVESSRRKFGFMAVAPDQKVRGKARAFLRFRTHRST
jgi:pimeloyl-ACP methyl ester carboxylesterase